MNYKKNEQELKMWQSKRDVCLTLASLMSPGGSFWGAVNMETQRITAKFKHANI